jgi:hypothetical protein
MAAGEPAEVPTDVKEVAARFVLLTLLACAAGALTVGLFCLTKPTFFATHLASCVIKPPFSETYF